MPAMMTTLMQVSGHKSGVTSLGTLDNKSENQLLFKGFVQGISTHPMAELSLMDADDSEYITRHSIDGTILFADHSISGIIGFLSSEAGKVGESQKFQEFARPLHLVICYDIAQWLTRCVDFRE